MPSAFAIGLVGHFAFCESVVSELAVFDVESSDVLEFADVPDVAGVCGCRAGCCVFAWLDEGALDNWKGANRIGGKDILKAKSRSPEVYQRYVQCPG